MSETTFAKSFLAALDARPVKLSTDHVEDLKNFPARTPYILPRMPKPMSKSTTVAPGQERSLTVLVKSLRNPPLDLKIASQPRTTSILELKAAVSERAHIPADKIKLLYRKKPVPDSKALGDLLDDGHADATEIELSFMAIGGAVSVPPSGTTPAETAPARSVAAGPSGEAVLQTAAFWDDLKGFLQQRLKDEKRADELSQLFRSAAESKR